MILSAQRTAQRPTGEHRERTVRCSGQFDAREFAITV
jgi:hypothetical protein